MKEWLGGSYLVMNGTPIFTGDIPIMDIVYRYNSRKFLGFIATEGGEITEPGYYYYLVTLTIILMFLF